MIGYPQKLDFCIISIFNDIVRHEDHVFGALLPWDISRSVSWLSKKSLLLKIHSRDKPLKDLVGVWPIFWYKFWIQILHSDLERGDRAGEDPLLTHFFI